MVRILPAPMTGTCEERQMLRIASMARSCSSIVPEKSKTRSLSAPFTL